MEIHEPYIPKEYLALKINYIKKQLAELPEVTVTQRTIHNVKKDVFIVNSKPISLTSKTANTKRHFASGRIGKKTRATRRTMEQLI